MREILFRGKSEPYGDWVEGFYYKAKFLITDKELCDYITIPHPEKEGRRSDHILVMSETIGQYTGLTDKNGKKIFEGDICDLSILGRDHALVEISIQHGCVGFEPLDYDSVHPDDQEWKSFWDNEERYMWNTNYFTVIGNIHDNPELLENN